MAFPSRADAMRGSTANVASRETAYGMPEFGVGSLKTPLDHVVGLPLVSDPQRPFPNYFGEGSHFAHSAAQLFIGTNRTTLPTQIVFHQILAGNFYVQVIAPIVPLSWNSSGVVEFDRLEFDTNMPQVLPEEGKTRIGSWSYDTKNFTVQRWGLGARFTHDFLLTPNGIARARGVIEQMKVSMEDHLKIGVLHALIHCRDAAAARIAERSVQPGLSQQQANMQRTLDYFGILQFRDDGVTRLLTDARTQMMAIGGEYDTALVHHQQQVYTVNLNPKMTTYSEVGPVAVENFTAIVGGDRKFGDANGPTTYLVEEFAHGKGKAPLDLLRDKVVVGHYATMHDHVPGGAGNNYKGWRAGYRDIRIMNGDNGSDDYATITMETALRNSGIWDQATGELIGPDHPSLKTFGDLDANTKRRCSFWLNDATGRPVSAIKHLGAQATPYFDSWHNLAETVLQTLPSNNIAEVVGAIQVLAGAVDRMAGVSYSNAVRDAILANAAGTAGIGAAAAGPLPAYMGSGAGLRAIRDFALSSDDATIIRARLSPESMRAVGRAVEVVQTYLIPHMLNGFGPNNAFLGDTPEAAFDGFVNNALAAHLIPLSSIAPGAEGGAAGRVGAAGALPDPRSAALQEAANRFQRSLTGFMGRYDDVAAGYLAGGGIAPVRAAAAAIAATGAAAAGRTAAVYDPNQQNGGGAVTTWALLKAALPAFAQASLAGVADAEVGAAAAGTKILAINLGGGRNAFSYTSAAAGADSAYDRLVRVLLNYGTNTRDVAQLTARGLVLLILSQTKETNDDLNRVMASLGVQAVDAGAPVAADFDHVAWLREGAAAVLGNMKPTPRGPLTLPALNKIITDYAATLTAELSAVPAADAAAPEGDLAARAFVTGVYRASPAAIRSWVANNIVMPTRAPGGRVGPVTGDAELRAFKAEVERGQMGAASMRDSDLSMLLRGRTYAPPTTMPVSYIGMAGGLPDVERAVRQAEGYGSNAPVRGPFREETTSALTLTSRYGAPVAGGADPDERPLEPAVPAVRRTPGLQSVYTPTFGATWKRIGESVPSVAHQAIARIGSGTPTNWVNQLSMIRAGFLIPWTPIIARPFAVYHTRSMFLLKAGRDTSMTILGQPNTTWGNDHVHQAFELTISFKSRTIVVKPENVLHIRHAFFCGYDSGHGVSFFTPSTLAQYLSMSDLSIDHPSIIVIVEPYQPYVGARPARVMSLDGSNKNVSLLNKFNDAALDSQAHYYNAGYANSMWGFPTYSLQGFYKDEGMRQLQQFVHGANENDIFFSRVDFICWKDQSLHVDPQTGKFTMMSRGRGPFPNDRIGPGFFDGLRGGTKEIPKHKHEHIYTFIDV